LGAPFPDDQIITGALHLNAQPRIDQRLGLSAKPKAGADPDANAAATGSAANAHSHGRLTRNASF
jgi:hypothetical protein